LHLNKRNSTNSYFLWNKLEVNIYALLRKKTNNKNNRKNKLNKNLNNINATKFTIVNNSYLII